MNIKYSDLIILFGIELSNMKLFQNEISLFIKHYRIFWEYPQFVEISFHINRRILLRWIRMLNIIWQYSFNHLIRYIIIEHEILSKRNFNLRQALTEFFKDLCYLWKFLIKWRILLRWILNVKYCLAISSWSFYSILNMKFNRFIHSLWIIFAFSHQSNTFKD